MKVRLGSRIGPCPTSHRQNRVGVTHATVTLKQIEYGVYGDLVTIYPSPYSIYLRGTIPLQNPTHFRETKPIPKPENPNSTGNSSGNGNANSTGFRVQGLGFRVHSSGNGNGNSTGNSDFTLGRGISSLMKAESLSISICRSAAPSCDDFGFYTLHGIPL